MTDKADRDDLDRSVRDEVRNQVQPKFEAFDMRAEEGRLRALREKWPPETDALIDPLREATRKLRRFVLGLSALVVAAVWAGLLPERISVLGIEFTSLESSKLLALTAGLLLFFLFEFVVYGLPDFQAFLLQLEEAETGWIHQQMKRRHGTDWQEAYYGRDQIAQDLEKLKRRWPTRRRLAIVRGLVDFLLPVVFGLGAGVWAIVEALSVGGSGG